MNPVKVATFKNVVVVFVALVRTRATKYIGSWIGERALICTGRTWPKLQCWWGNCQARLINYCLFSVWSVATQVDRIEQQYRGTFIETENKGGVRFEVSFRKAYTGRGYYCLERQQYTNTPCSQQDQEVTDRYTHPRFREGSPKLRYM